MSARLVATVAFLATIAAACGRVLDDGGDAPGASASDGGDVPDPGRDGGSPDGAPDDGAPVDRAGGGLYRAQVMSDAPLAYYRLEETVDVLGAADETGAFPAVYFGAFQLRPALAGDGFARTFISSSSVSATVDPAFDFPGASPMSVEAWIAPNSMSSGPRTVLSHFVPNPSNDPASRGRGYLLEVADETLTFYRGRATQGAGIGTPLLGNGPYHVVATYDGAIMSLYVDGSLVKAEPSNVMLEAEGVAFAVGARETIAGFDGTIDEVAVYPRALTPKRIRAHFDAR
ncbi:MAG: LamG domain-containing protein [Labilithrix sp.]|nr:LamG domain-containing protein [Labilithrix sp.]